MKLVKSALQLQSFTNSLSSSPDDPTRRHRVEIVAGNNMAEGKSRTFLWCVPRSISSALTKCLTATKDLEVWFEPFFFCFVARLDAKKRLGVDLPRSYHGNEDVFQEVADLLKSFSHCTFKPDHLAYESVKERLEGTQGDHVFVKDMGFAMGKNDLACIPSDYKHTFLIRHPLRVLKSNRKAMFDQFSQLGMLEGDAADEQTFDLERDDPYMTPGLLFKDLYDVWNHVRENFDEDPIIMDADDILSNPAEMLSKYCRAVGLPYDEALLKFREDLDVFQIWKAPIEAEELRMTVSAFSGTATSSVEFMSAKPMPSREEMTPDVTRCSDQIIAYYEEMYEFRMKV
ncbi:uncharacterized protein [Diadema antillarum]|uniref:uncharacterized protein n=1 Tax=Diadema antillarum TaxID=105358 RepID=UPI003A86BAE0